MTLPDDAKPDVLGVQRPRISSFPNCSTGSGEEAIEVATRAGLILDDWEKFVLVNAMGERPDGKWAATEVGLVVPRQNGKGVILAARELASLFVVEGEEVIIHTAHEQKTASEHFRRVLTLIKNVPDFRRRLTKEIHGKGSEAIEVGDKRMFFQTRTGGAGRGLTIDLLVFDEAMILPEAFVSAVGATLSARTLLTPMGVQLWYAGSAVDQQSNENGVVLARIRERGIAGDPDLAYFEWSVPVDLDKLTPGIASDPEYWAMANPGLGVRISHEHVAKEHRGGILGGRRGFAVERLGAGDWPATEETDDRVIPLESWLACVDATSEADDPIVVAYDINPSRTTTSIAACGVREDSLLHVELIHQLSGTEGLAEFLRGLRQRHKVVSVVVDPAGPAGSTVAEVAEVLGTRSNGDPILTQVTAKIHAQAAGQFYDLVMERKLRHRGQPELESAVDGAKARPLGDAWGWHRRSSSVDISSLVAGTLSVWGFSQMPKARPRVVNLANV